MFLCSRSWKARRGSLRRQSNTRSNNKEKSCLKPCCTLQANRDFGSDLFSSWTKTPNIKPKLHGAGFKTTMLQSQSSQSRVLSSIQSRINGRVPVATWQHFIHTLTQELPDVQTCLQRLRSRLDWASTSATNGLFHFIWICRDLKSQQI